MARPSIVELAFQLHAKEEARARRRPSSAKEKPEVAKPTRAAKGSSLSKRQPDQPQERADARAQRIAAQRPPPTLRRGVMTGTTSGQPVDKEGALQHQGYMRVVRGLACRRCNYQPQGKARNQFAHADQGKGQGIKTDVREGAALCGPHDKLPGCHWVMGTSGQLPKEERRQLEKEYAASTREEVEARGLWPKTLPKWPGKKERPQAA